MNSLTQLLAQGNESVKTKKCPVCGKVKPTWDFAKDKAKKDGYNYCCRSCKNKLDTTYRNTEFGYLNTNLNFKRNNVKCSYLVFLGWS